MSHKNHLPTTKEYVSNVAKVWMYLFYSSIVVCEWLLHSRKLQISV